MPDRVLLSVHGLNAFYNDFQALFDLSLDVKEGEVVAIIGANGAGKSTLLKTIAGLMTAPPDDIQLDNQSIGGRPPYEIVARGIALVPEGRRLFPSLTVEENLAIGAQVNRPGRWNLARVYELFPDLFARRNHLSTTLSGGQQQMVAIGRALMSNPNIILCDELSLGLAPIIVRDIYAHLGKIISEGTSAIIVEQDIQQALKIADRVYCMLEGRIVLEGSAGSLSREAIAAAYFGV